MAGGTQIDAYNLALSYLGKAQRIQTLTDPSPAAGYCNTFWDRARKVVLEQGYWTFATRAAALSLVVDQEQLAASAQMYPGWRYVYQQPNDCLKAQAVTTQYGLRVNPFMSFWWRNLDNANYWGPFRPPWTKALDYYGTPTGQQIDILTDQDSAWLVYTVDPPNLALLPETFLDCCAWALAVRIAGPVAAAEKRGELAIKMAEQSLSRAFAQNLNDEQPDSYPQSPSIQARL